jgi:signal transduction histidine kinase
MHWSKKLSTQTKTFLFVTIVLLIFSSTIIYNFHYYEQKILHAIESTSHKHIHILYHHLLEDYRSFYRHVLREIAHSQSIKETFVSLDREQLFNLSMRLWNRLKKEDIRSNLIHYHLPNGNSFLRVHQPYRYDDNISALRQMPRYLHKHQRTSFGFERGIYALAYRAFTPLFHRGRYIGAVEFGSRPDYMLDRFKEFQNLHGIIFIKKSELDLYREEISTFTIGEYRLQYSNLNKEKEFVNKLKKIDYDFQDHYGIKIDKKIYNIYTLDMKNFRDQNVAKILIVQDVTTLYRSVKEQLLSIVFTIFLLTILILSIIYLGFRSFIGKLDAQNLQLQCHERELEDRVEQQVSIIHQKESLIRQQSKMVEVGNMLGAITHQWKQPLSVISTLIADLMIKLILQKPNKESCQLCTEEWDELVKRYLNNITLEVEFMNQTIEDFRNFLKPSKQQQNFSIIQEIKRVERLLKPVLHKSAITIHLSVDEIDDDNIVGYPTEFAQVILNLINNAKDAIVQNNPNNRDIDIAIHKKEQNIEITIQDYAGGVSSDAIESLFEPYYTTKGDEGTGIGLAISRDILHNMNGTIDAKNLHGGACFAIEINMNN